MTSTVHKYFITHRSGLIPGRIHAISHGFTACIFKADIEEDFNSFGSDSNQKQKNHKTARSIRKNMLRKICEKW